LSGSVTAVTYAATEAASPVAGLRPSTMVQPSHTKSPSARKTWRVLMASPIATMGGTMDSQP